MGVFATPFVQPRTVRLDLSDGHWIEVKEQLSYGDLQLVASQARGDLTRAPIELVAGFLVDWSLTTENGSGPVPVPIDDPTKKMAALRALQAPAFAAIEDAIEQHRKATDAAKKAGAPSGRRRSARRSA